jgi:NADH-quinone oxidoreductase subunit N
VTDRLAFLYPEMALFVATCVVMVMGLSHSAATRRATAFVAGLGVIAAGLLAVFTTPQGPNLSPNAGQLLLPWLPVYAKVVMCCVALPLLLVLGGTVDRAEEAAIAAGKAKYDALRANRAEFYSFFLFSLTGLLLTASADDLIWLFLALELTSLPTYIMVTISSGRNRAREAGVKYFFLGAMGAAIFLYGFALIYGATGTTNLNAIYESFGDKGLSTLGLAGVLLAVVGLGFKIAAVPMHFYTADVYQGAASQVSAMLAFVPKTAGFVALLLILSAVGWRFAPDAQDGVWMVNANAASLPEPIRILLWIMAVLTMTAGNVLAVLQNSVKRMLAYSSIAHSGYMLVGLIAGPGDGSFTQNGLSAVLFYLMSYGVMNVGTFAVLAALERKARSADDEPREIDSIDDLRGLWKAYPMLATVMAVCALSLLGLPPLLGFWGKLPLFTAGIAAGEIPLVIILGVNSAIAAFYYLRLVTVPVLEQPDTQSEPLVLAPFKGRKLAGYLSAAGVIVLSIVGNAVMVKAGEAGMSMVSHARSIEPAKNRAPVRPSQPEAEEPAAETPEAAPDAATEAAKPAHGM